MNGPKCVQEIVVQVLNAEGYDGLYNADNSCACELGDLAPCGEMQPDCRTGYKHVITAEDIDSGRFDHFDAPPSMEDIGRYWVIVRERDP